MTLMFPPSPKLKNMARAAAWIAVIGMVLVGGTCVYLAFHPDLVVESLQQGTLPNSNLPTDMVLLIAAAVAFLPIALFLIGMWEARTMFHLIGDGFLLDQDCQKSMVRLGRLAIASAVLGIVARTLILVLMTSNNPPGQKMLSIGIGSGEISSLIIGLLFFIFALVVKETASIAEENRSII